MQTILSFSVFNNFINEVKNVLYAEFYTGKNEVLIS